MIPSDAIPIAAAALIWMFILVDLSNRTRKVRQKLFLLKQQVPDSVLAVFFVSCGLKGSVSGVPFSITVTPGGNRSSPKIVIACARKTPFKLVILRNEPQSDFFARLAHIPVLSAVRKTNDPHFDTRFCIYSHNTTDVTGYFYNSARKAAVQKIFDLGYTVLEFKGAAVTARKHEYDAEQDLQADVLKTALDKVIVLAKGFNSGAAQ
ncbi:MAG TPA: hypothetical protein PKL03_07115 [Candidatus Omnitrophota bacterium]|nr:hypothetical protein [Candidatus Omnitrophota bacterium]HNQ51192.1 hypothetical protein [Candidatus Omnitrophota bacterium]